MTYRPTEEDLAWAESLINIVKDGGLWGWPSAGLTYKVNKESFELVLLNQDKLADPEALELHKRTIVVFDRIGFTVLP